MWHNNIFESFQQEWLFSSSREHSTYYSRIRVLPRTFIKVLRGLGCESAQLYSTVT